MRYLIIIFVLFALLVLQTGVLGNLGLGKAGSLPLLYVLITVMLAKFRQGLFTALAAGVMLDLASATRAGTITVAMLAVLGLVYFVINKVITRELNRFILVVCIILGTIAFSVSVVLFNRVLNLVNLGIMLDWRFILGRKLILDLTVNLIFAYPILLLYEFIRRQKLSQS
ncbi:MAG: rod shape-determining protein MreD [Candidatus Doudnabacteria bacterium]|nr:rod shape-determining protein MreD [Candidatus Doudnabacteria bacterium]